ncbi:hypothetical protein HYH03_019196, partial [Edaphochlamys debaryana]
TTTVATLTVTASPSSSAPPTLTPWKPCRPYYLQDLRNLAVQARRTVSLAPDAINNLKYDPANPQFNFTIKTVQEWGITNVNAHPFHLHISPFQLVNQVPTGGPANWFALGDWQDTLASGNATNQGGIIVDLTYPSPCCFNPSIRFRTEFVGKVIVHCHILTHEDAGAMALTKSIGTGGVTAAMISTSLSFVCPP